MLSVSQTFKNQITEIEIINIFTYAAGAHQYPFAEETLILTRTDTRSFIRVSEDLLLTIHSGSLKVATFLASLLVVKSKRIMQQDVDQYI